MDVTHIPCGADGWAHLTTVIDCHDREVMGYEFALRGRAKEAERALEAACLHRFGTLRPQGTVPVVRSDNGLISQSRRFRAACRDYRLAQEFITPYTPEQNGVIERFFRSLKEECVWQHRFSTFAEAQQRLRAWLTWYKHGPAASGAGVSQSDAVSSGTPGSGGLMRLSRLASIGSGVCGYCRRIVGVTILTPLPSAAETSAVMLAYLDKACARRKAAGGAGACRGSPRSGVWDGNRAKVTAADGDIQGEAVRILLGGLPCALSGVTRTICERVRALWPATPTRPA
jgi:hypothetical protein